MGGKYAAARLFTMSTGHEDASVRQLAELALMKVEARLKDEQKIKKACRVSRNKKSFHDCDLPFLVWGCSHDQTPLLGPSQSALGTANDYFPATVGSSWTYKITPAPVEKNIETVTMEKALPGNRFQDSKGNVFRPDIRYSRWRSVFN